MTQMEDAQNGFDRDKTDVNFWIAGIRGNQKYGSRNPDAAERAGRPANRSDQLHGGSSERNAQGIAETDDRNGKVNVRLDVLR